MILLRGHLPHVASVGVVLIVVEDALVQQLLYPVIGHVAVERDRAQPEGVVPAVHVLREIGAGGCGGQFGNAGGEICGNCCSELAWMFLARAWVLCRSFLNASSCCMVAVGRPAG